MPETNIKEKTVVIKPESADISVLATALCIQNGFVKKGFKSRGAFITIVQEYLDEFRNYNKVRILEGWWLLRVRDTELNERLQTVLNKLGNE